MTGDPFPYTCGIPAEPLERYAPSGFHPIILRDTFSHGRYRVIHKLGWGGYSTTWLVRDSLKNRNVVLKVARADASTKSRPSEKDILRTLATLSNTHPGYAHLVQLLDAFEVRGPNGRHECLVLELLGPSVQNTNHEVFMYDPFPASLAKRIATQVLQVLDLMSRNGIAHGGQ